jgi:nitrilase
VRRVSNPPTINQPRTAQLDDPLLNSHALQNRHWFPSTTILSAAQRPRLHIGCYPFAHDFENTSDSQWYNGNTIVRASPSYALLSGAYVLMPSVGYTFVLDPMMRTVA